MRNKNVSLLVLSLSIVASPFISCNEATNDLNQENTLRKREFSKLQSFKDNFGSIKEIFDAGVTESNLGELLELMGYQSDAMTIRQFNELYEEMSQIDVGNMSLDDMLNMSYYQSKPESFKNAIRDVFSGADLSSYFNSVEYQRLSDENKELLQSFYTIRTELGSGNVTTAFYDYGPGINVPVSDTTASVLLHVGVGAFIGGVIGGPVGAGIGAGIGFITGIVATSLK